MGPVVAIPDRARRLLKIAMRARNPIDRSITLWHVRNIIREANGVPLRDRQCRKRNPCERQRRM